MDLAGRHGGPRRFGLAHPLHPTNRPQAYVRQSDPNTWSTYTSAIQRVEAIDFVETYEQHSLRVHMQNKQTLPEQKPVKLILKENN